MIVHQLVHISGSCFSILVGNPKTKRKYREALVIAERADPKTRFVVKTRAGRVLYQDADIEYYWSRKNDPIVGVFICASQSALNRRDRRYLPHDAFSGEIRCYFHQRPVAAPLVFFGWAGIIRPSAISLRKYCISERKYIAHLSMCRPCPGNEIWFGWFEICYFYWLNGRLGWKYPPPNCVSVNKDGADSSNQTNNNHCDLDKRGDAAPYFIKARAHPFPPRLRL